MSKKSENTEKIEKKESSFINKELWGMVLIASSAFLFLCLVTGDNLFSPVGKWLQGFLLGFSGFFSFPLLLFVFFCGFMIVIGRKVQNGKGKLNAVMISICLVCGFAITHLAVSPVGGSSVGDYSASCYNVGFGGFAASTIGGVLFGFIDVLLVKSVSDVGTYVIWGIIATIAAFIALRDVILPGKRNEAKRENVKDNENISETGENVSSFASASDGNEKQTERKENDFIKSPSEVRKRTLIVGGDSDFEMKKEEPVYAEKVASDDYTDIAKNKKKPTYYSDEFDSDYEGKTRSVKSSGFVSYGKKDEEFYDSKKKRGTAYDTTSGDENDGINEDIYMPNSFKAAVSRHAQKKSSVYSNDIEEQMEEVNSKVGDDVVTDGKVSLDEPLSGTDDFGSKNVYEDIPKRRTEAVKAESERNDYKQSGFSKSDATTRSGEKPTSEKGEEEEVNPYDEMPLNFRYNAPPIDLLKTYSREENYGEVEMFKHEKAAKIINTLKVLGGVEVTLAKTVHGPTVTRFDFAIPDNVSIKTVLKYADDLKLRLETKNEIRIIAIPGESLIGIEVANEKRSMVGLKDVIESDAFRNTKKTSLTFAIGKDIVGNPVVADITKTLHLLIAGASGTGKSVGLNTLLISWFYKYSPADLRLIIVDPKLVEFKVFEGIPHLLFGDIITDAKTAVAMLNWAVKEMEARYAKMANLVVHNIEEYNDLIDPRKDRKLPKIVIIIDEFADLMSTDKKSIEEKIGRLAQKARAAGMYLILATQRPSVNIIEGSIKTNFISRMAFKMSNGTDSTTILGEGGAEKLLGNGDLLYKMGYMTNCERAQGAYIDMSEIKAVVNYIKENNKCYFNEAAMKEISGEANPQIEDVNGKESGGDAKDVPDYYIKALKIAVELRYVSISLIQRKLDSCGFPKAAKIFDWMVKQGYVLNSQTDKQKQVTLTKEEFDELYGDYDV